MSTLPPLMNGLLLIPAPYVDRGKIVPYVPYGLLSLQAAAEGCGPVVDILRLDPLGDRVFSSSDELACAIADFVPADKYEVIGLSTMCSSFHHSVGIATELKRRHPRIRIWMGGPHVSVHPSAALTSYPQIEAVFVGEAEETLRYLLARPYGLQQSSPARHPGVRTRESPFLARPVIRVLDALPCIADAHDLLGSLEGSAYTRFEFPLEAERGCTGRCSFCSTSIYWGRRVRRKSAGRLLQEMQRLTALTGYTSVSLIGDNLATSRRWLLELCKAFREGGPDDLKWGCSLTLGSLQVEDLDALWQSGCRTIFVGLESASPATLARIGKKIDLRRSLVLLDHALGKGFGIQVSFIVGFPWETSADLKDTYDLHLRVLKRGAGSQITSLCPLPGTLLEQTQPIYAGEGISTTAFDGLPHGVTAREIVHSCPDLFTQFARFETPSVQPAEVGAVVRAAEMASVHFRRQRQARKPA